MDEPLDCWDDYPMEHGCICGNDCAPPEWMRKMWARENGAPCVCGAPFDSPECRSRAHLRGPQAALDPEPYVWSGTKLRTRIKHDGEAVDFDPRPGFSQNKEDYA